MNQNFMMAQLSLPLNLSNDFGRPKIIIRTTYKNIQAAIPAILSEAVKVFYKLNITYVDLRHYP